MSTNYHGYGLALNAREPSFDAPLLIAPLGKAGAGKSTLAKILAERYGQQVGRFGWADGVKTEAFDWIRSGKRFLPALYANIPADGLPAIYVDATTALDATFTRFPVLPEDADKIAWVNDNKPLLRPLLQWWGTEFRRSQDPEYWIKRGVARHNELLAEKRYVAIINDDTRFPNEVAALRELGYKIVRINIGDHEQVERLTERDGAFDPAIREHASENSVDHVYPDYTVANNGTVDDFRIAIGATLNEMLR